MKYSDFVDYGKLDPFKRAIINKLSPELKNLDPLGIRVVPESLGEPAALLDFVNDDFMLALKSDGVGTKNKIAEAMMAADPSLDVASLWRGFGQDLIAMNVNDLICVGATPLALTDEIAVGDSAWFDNSARVEGLLDGFAQAAREAEITIPCGETPTLKDIVKDDTATITGSMLGLVRPKERALFGQKLEPGDVIVGLMGNGIHSNGITLARKIAEQQPDGYLTKLPGGQLLGNLLLKPTALYNKPVLAMFEAGLDIHYISNVTGSAFRKLMRPKRSLRYVIDRLPAPQSEFVWMQEHGDVNDEEAYQTWNMGVGMVLYVPRQEVQRVVAKAAEFDVRAWPIGQVEQAEEGLREVVIPSKGIVYREDV